MPDHGSDIFDPHQIGDVTDPGVDTPLEKRMLERVNADFSDATQFLTTFHQNCVDAYQMYHNASRYYDLKKESLVPVPFFQEQIDTFVVSMQEKLFFKNRPCTVVGREDTDKEDAAAKQDMLDYQDQQDKIYSKVELLLRDAAMYRVCVAQTDYIDIKQRQLVGVEEEATRVNIFGETVPITDEQGRPMSISKVVTQDVPIYMGPGTKRIDPIDFFITRDKVTMDDDFPVMIRSRHSLKHFKVKPGMEYWINFEQLKSADGIEAGGAMASEAQDHIETKRMIRGLKGDTGDTKKDLEYVEWQGKVNKKQLWQYMGKATEIEQEGETIQVVTNDEDTWAICGVVDRKTVVRLEETPFEFQSSNVVVGVIQSDENEVLGTSLADKIFAIAQTMQVVMGMLMENFKQSVNAGHVLKTNAMKAGQKGTKVNEPGFVFETTESVNDVYKRIEPARVAPDLYIMMTELLPQMGQDASGLQDLISGKGEPGAETLGATELIAGQASLKLIAYLKSFETTLIQPVYVMRNQINMQMLNQEYVIRVIGEAGFEWRTIQPGEIRANVDFICESASRETNRLVITQQFIQTMGVVGAVVSQGFVVRTDKMLADLLSNGFNMDPKKVKDYIPTLKLEEQGMDLDQLLIQNMLVQFQANLAIAAQSGIQAGQPEGQGGNSPQPRSEGEARDSANSRNQTPVGRQ